MSQHSAFEETFQNGPQPMPSYEEGHAGPQPVAYKEHAFGQKLLVSDPQIRNTPSVGQRVGLALISLVLVFCVLVITLNIALRSNVPSMLLATLFALVFTNVMVVINIIFHRRKTVDQKGMIVMPQHSMFEETFQDGLQPTPSYEEGYTGL